MRDIARRLDIALFGIEGAYSWNEKKRRISRNELNVLYALDDGKPHSQIEISHEWLVPKTTVNTIVKRWEKLGYVIQNPVSGKCREMEIVLTEAGKAYGAEIMSPLYRAEDIALRKTLDRYSDDFIEVLEYFGNSLREAFEKGDID